MNRHFLYGDDLLSPDRHVDVAYEESRRCAVLTFLHGVIPDMTVSVFDLLVEEPDLCRANNITGPYDWMARRLYDMPFDWVAWAEWAPEEWAWPEELEADE